MQGKETHWKNLTNPDYLGAYSFNDVVGAGTNATISKIVREMVYNPTTSKKEECTVAHFSGQSKPMILNKTNCKAIQAICGTPFIERWAGVTVFIEVQKVKIKGALTLALRIVAPKQAPDMQQAQVIVDPEMLHCEDCNDYIQGHGQYTAQQVAAHMRANYGKDLCADCGARAKARKEKEQELQALEGTHNDTNA